MMRRWPFLRSLRPGQVRADEREAIHEEIELYLDLRTEELMSEEGVSRDEARRAAERRFGDAARIEAELAQRDRRRRAKRGWMMTMSGVMRDLGYAVRTFRRNPGFSLVAVGTLALALGGNTAIFSVVDAALLQALPFEHHEQLYYLNGYQLVDGEPSIRGASYPEFRDWRARSRSFSSMAAVGGASLALTGGGDAERMPVEVVTRDYFDVLDVESAVGRTFLPEEHAEVDAHPVVVVSQALFERRYGSDPSVLGTTIELNDRPMTVVGIMPEGFGGIYLTTDLWIPDGQVSVVMDAGILEARGDRFLDVIARLAPGDRPEAAQVELDGIARELQASFPSVHEDRFAQVQSFRTAYLGSTGDLLWILMAGGAVLLLIAAANVANLLLVRSHGRTREIVLRRALGAEGRRVGMQLMTESIVLAVLGGIGGLVLAVFGLGVLGPMIPQGVLPGYVEPRLSGTAFLYSLAVLAAVGVLTGLLPAVASARLDIATRLREGARGAGGGRHRLRTKHVFVVAQVALALVLMTGAGLLGRSFRAQVAVDTGADLGQVVALRVELPRTVYATSDAIWNFASELERRLGEVTGVASVALSSDLPFRGNSSAAYIYQQGADPEDRIRYHRHQVTADYFETLGIDLLQGRLLDDRDTDDTPGVIVITDAMARRVFPGGSAVGRTMSLRPDGTMTAEIVGVVADVRYRDLTTSLFAEANSPDVFFSFWQIPSSSLEVSVRARGDASTIIPEVRRTVAELDPKLPVFAMQPLAEAYRQQTATPRFAAFLMGLFSLLAVVLACVGVYGLLAFAVSERSREIAIRRAVGASASGVARSVVLDGLELGAIGLVVGGVGALLGARILAAREGVLFGVSPSDPVTFVGVGLAILAVALAGALVPALRAMRRDPAEALGAE